MTFPEFSPLCIQINEEIVVAALALFKYDAAKKEEYPALRRIGRFLKDVSRIDCKNWCALKLATAFKIICTHEIGDSDEMLSKDLQLKLLEDADGYKDLIDRPHCMTTYRRLVSTHRVCTQSMGILASLVKKAKAHEADLYSRRMKARAALRSLFGTSLKRSLWWERGVSVRATRRRRRRRL